MSDYEWYETPYGKFRIEKKSFGTWSSYGENGEGCITGLTKEVVLAGTAFYLEGKSTNWTNANNSQTFDGTVGGKL